MQTHDEFWLALHDMAVSLDTDKLSIKQKADTLAEYWALYPPSAAKKLAEEFQFVLDVFTALNPMLPEHK